MDITIVIPTFNRKDLLKITLGSIFHGPMSQTHVIVVDNGSTDGTSSFLDSFVRSHPTVTYTTEKQRCASAARNKGLSLVNTTWVYFFDSDDEFEDIPHDWDKSADLIAFPTRQKVGNSISIRANKPVADPAVHIINGMLSTQSMIFRTAWLRKIGGWNTKCYVWDDWELGARALMSAPKLQWITSKAYHVINVHPDSLTGPSMKSRYKLQLSTLAQILDYTNRTKSPVMANCRKALLFRTFILSGKLLYEGDKKASAICHTFIYENFGRKPSGYKIGWILEQYTATGGRGAWKIALWIITRRTSHEDFADRRIQ